jgi:hypothetical protein
MRRSLVVIAVVLLASVSGCGDDNERGATSRGTATTAADTQTTAAGGRYCEALRSYFDQFERSRQITDPEELRDLLGDAHSALDEAKNIAPPEVKADTEVLARVINEYVEALEDVDYNASRIRADVVQSLLSPDFLSAAQRVSTYTTTNCS